MPNLLDYRRALGTALQSLIVTAATAGSTTSTLECASYPIKTSRPVDNLFEDWFIHRPSAALPADKTRVVSTYAPASGKLYPDLGWTNAPAVAEAIELHGLIEPSVEIPGLINAALKRCVLVEEVTLTPADAVTTRHSLASVAPWIEDDRQIRKAGYLVSGETRASTDPFRRMVRGETAMRGGVCYADIGAWPTTTILYFLVLKPAYYHCKPAAGAYGDQAGLALDTDVAPVDLEWAVAGAMVEAWQRFGHILEASANTRMLRDQATSALLFDDQCRQHLDVPRREMNRPMTWGPRR